MDTEIDSYQLATMDEHHDTTCSYNVCFTSMETEMDITPFKPVMLKHCKRKGNKGAAHKKKSKKPPTNGGLCSFLSPKHYNKSDSSSSDSHSTTTLDSKPNKSDNSFTPLSENFYQAGSN